MASAAAAADSLGRIAGCSTWLRELIYSPAPKFLCNGRTRQQ